MRDITPPILAKRIRFIPYSKVKRTICLRVEIYGCSFEGFLRFSKIIDSRHLILSFVTFKMVLFGIRYHKAIVGMISISSIILMTGVLIIIF